MGGFLQRKALAPAIVAATALALMAGGRLPAQQTRPAPPLIEALVPPKHLPPAKSNAVSTPEVVFDATHLGSPLTLDKDWRVGVTSNPAAADPGFDDSKWLLRNAGDSLDGLEDLDHPSGTPPTNPSPGPHPGHGRPYVWFRLHIKLTPNHGPVALLIELPVSQNTTMSIEASGPGVDVFANGKQIEPQGPHGNSPGRYQEISRLYNLGIGPADTDLTLVVRTIYIPFGLTAYTNFFADRQLRIGNPQDLQRALDLWSAHNLFERIPRLVDSVLLAVLAAFLLALYFSQKGHIEYLWLALHELVQAPIGFIDLAGSSAQLDQLWYAALVLQLVVVSAYLYFEFLISFLALKKRWYILLLRYTSPILAGVGPALYLLGTHSAPALILMVLITIGSLCWIGAWLLFILITLVSATLRRNFEAGMLLIPLVLTIVGIVEPILTGGVTDWVGHTYHSPLTLQAGLIPIHFASIADFTGLLAIVLIIFFRFLRIQHDQERANSELAAARSVQELMIPMEKLETPGYEVDSVYNPANEVGGDFFHLQQAGDGGLLVVIGDVAGKGLKAAMTVSMLMGALRRIPEKSPARILESLNRVLTGGEGLTTCQAVWFGANGELVIASAGHLPPYLNSQEIVLPGGLPLGAVPDVTYDEVSLYLHPGDRLLLMSDGVVEAMRPTGELFGFDRVHNLSNQSAFYIADAAKEFGQEDDITVLTVTRLVEAFAA
jgi:Stage II sporulation protein E (SpoIIE)